MESRHSKRRLTKRDRADWSSSQLSSCLSLALEQRFFWLYRSQSSEQLLMATVPATAQNQRRRDLRTSTAI